MAMHFRYFYAVRGEEIHEQILTGFHYFYGVIVSNDGLNPTTVTVYDSVGLAGSPKEILPTQTFKGSLQLQKEFLPAPFQTRKGIYLVVKGKGAKKVRVFYGAR